MSSKWHQTLLWEPKALAAKVVTVSAATDDAEGLGNDKRENPWQWAPATVASYHPVAKRIQEAVV